MYNMQEIRAIETLDEATTIIRNEMESVFDGFIAIGYYLKKVRDDQLYKQNGYESIFDYGQKVFNLSRYSTTRFMEVNDQYSIGGYSPEIDERWKGYGSSKLIEMLAIPGEIREEIPPEVTVKEIREAKTIIRETEEKFDPQMSLCDVAQEEEPEEWMKDLAKHLFREDKKAFEQMVEFERSDIGNDRAGIEEDVLFMTNPSKFKMIRLEKANVMMLEKTIRVMPYKVGGELKEPEEFSYIDLAMAFEEVFFPDFPDISGSMQSIYERVYGVPLYETVEKKEEKPQEEKKREKPKEKLQEKPKKLQEKPQEKKEEAKPEVPKEKPEEIPKEEQIPGQMELTGDFPEYCPEEVMNPPETVRRAYTSRLLYMASRGDEEAAVYMASCMEEKIRSMKNVSFGILAQAEFWEDFFKAEVDKEGKEIECVQG